MNARRTLSHIIGLIASEKAALAHAESRYKANRRYGFKSHNHQLHCNELVVRYTREGHHARAERESNRARRYGGAAHRGHARAQYWFAEMRRISHRIHKLEWQRGEVEEHVDKTLVMFDSVTISEIPSNAPAVAGYTGGLYHTFPQLLKDFPHAKHLSIAISAVDRGRCLDIETGDATPYEFPAWLHRELAAHPAEKPMGYGSVSSWIEILSLAERAGHNRGEFLVFTAHYTDQPHVCGPHTCGALPWDANLTQWTSAALGKNLDESRLTAGVFA